MNSEQNERAQALIQSFNQTLETLEKIADELTPLIKPEPKIGEANSYVEYFAPIGLVETARMAKNVYDFKDRLDSIKKLYENLNTMFTRNVLPDLIDDAGLQSPVKIDGVAKLVLQPDLFVDSKYGSDEQQKFFDWLIGIGQSDLIKETVNASSLKSSLKAILAHNNKLMELNRGKDVKEIEGYVEIPADLLVVKPFQKVAFNKL